LDHPVQYEQYELVTLRLKASRPSDRSKGPCQLGKDRDALTARYLPCELVVNFYIDLGRHETLATTTSVNRIVSTVDVYANYSPLGN